MTAVAIWTAVKTAAGIVWRVLRAIPWQAYAAAALIAAFYFHGTARYAAGVRVTNQARDEQAAIDAARIDKLARDLAAAQSAETTRIVTEYVDRVREVRVAGRTILKEVPVYVHANTPDLPAGFRIVHDAAATGVPPVPGTAPGADAGADSATPAAPVPAQVAAATVADNYATCRETAAQLAGLQQWVASQHDLSRKQAPHR